MRRINRWILFELLFLGFVALIVNLTFFQEGTANESYHVTMNRIVDQIAHGIPIDQLEYQDVRIQRVFFVEPEEKALLYECSEHISYWMIYNDTGTIEKIVGFEFYDEKARRRKRLFVNAVILLLAITVTSVLLAVKYKILKPFHALERIPEELAKGRLNLQIKEVKHKYFGKFLWGVNMLQNRLKTEQDHSMELKKEQHTLLTSISHGIKTPVTNIILYAESIQSGIITGEQVKKSAERISENAQKINILVKELLNSSSKSETDVTIELGRFYLKEIQKEIESTYMERMKLLQIEFCVQCEKDLMLSSDEQALLICIGNLLENAIKYGDGKRIEVSMEAEEEMVWFRVVNTGDPIPTHELPHIFTSFWRGSNAKEKDGNGLGLYICRNYVRKLGGDLQAQCHAGVTEFILAVPIDSSLYQNKSFLP